MPQYYVCVTVLLIFMSTRLIGSDGFRHLFAYYTFTENLSPLHMVPLTVPYGLWA